MRPRNTPMPALGRQLNLMFETHELNGLSDKEQEKAISTLALMQAAGLIVEELNDDRH